MHDRILKGRVAGRSSINLYKDVFEKDNTYTKNFHEDVLWLVNSESKLVLKHGGQLVKTSVSDNDYYGYLTSIELNDEFDVLCNSLHITNKSSLSAEIITSISMTPYIETKEKNNIYDPKSEVYGLDVPAEFKIPRFIGSGNNGVYLGSLYKTNIDKKIIRSSHWSDNKNSYAQASALDIWSNDDWIEEKFNQLMNSLTLEVDEAFQVIQSFKVLSA